MSFFDVFLGRTRPVKSKIEKLFAMATARVTLNASLGLVPSGRAAICFRPVTSSYFASAEEEMKRILEIGARDMGTKPLAVKDSYGFQWILLEDDDFEDLVAALHIISQTLFEHRFGEQLLAAVFQFVDQQQHLVYWVYSYKRGYFYPFVPTGDRSRDNAYELRLRAVMEKELPIEAELERWFALWDIPLSRESGHRQ